VLVDFFLHLKDRALPVSTKEFLTLLAALRQGVIGHSLDDFYVLARTTLVKDEAHFDRFDRAFAEYFKGIEALPGMDKAIPEEWLRQSMKRHLTPEEQAKLEKLGWDKLMEEFEKRLAEQKGRHAGGSKWISPAVLSDGRKVLRACITSHRTEERDLDVLVDELRAALGDVSGNA